ncbi:MAG: DUF4338 domain-containing protein [Verrucomicrobia bacterium]|nr:DUF4338 domain-containing protein [Verrucomicrobiota bacterium]
MNRARGPDSCARSAAPRGRRQGLPRITNQQRFLIVPWVRVAHLASHVLALALKRLSGDWQTRLGALQATQWGLLAKRSQEETAALDCAVCKVPALCGARIRRAVCLPGSGCFP